MVGGCWVGSNMVDGLVVDGRWAGGGSVGNRESVDGGLSVVGGFVTRPAI